MQVKFEILIETRDMDVFELAKFVDTAVRFAPLPNPELDPAGRFIDRLTMVIKEVIE